MTVPTMTATEARNFARQSPTNAAIVEEAIRAAGCQAGCSAYSSIFTYKRWTAQGMQVRRGEHGAKAVTYVGTCRACRDGACPDHRKPPVRAKTYTVFCACQVEAKGAS